MCAAFVPALFGRLKGMGDSSVHPVADICCLKMQLTTVASFCPPRAVCRPQISCRRCHLAFHTLCLPTPAVSPSDWKPGDKWTCASCSYVNEVGSTAAAHEAAACIVAYGNAKRSA